MSPVDLSNGPCFSTVERGERMLPREHVDHYQHSIWKHRKPMSTGGGRAWSEEEVSRWCRWCYWPWSADMHIGDVSDREASPKGALQSHRCSSAQDRSGLSPTLSPAQKSEWSTGAHTLNVIIQCVESVVWFDSPRVNINNETGLFSKCLMRQPWARQVHKRRNPFASRFSSTSSCHHPPSTCFVLPSAVERSSSGHHQRVCLPATCHAHDWRGSPPTSLWVSLPALLGSRCRQLRFKCRSCHAGESVEQNHFNRHREWSTPSVSPQTATAVPSVLAHASRGPKKCDCPSQFHAINEIPIINPVATAAEKSSFSISSLLTGRKEHETRWGKGIGPLCHSA